MDGKKGYFVGIVLIILAIFVVLAFFPRREVSAPSEIPQPGDTVEEKTVVPAPLADIVTLPLATELSATLHRAEGSVEEDLQTVAQILYFYRQGLGENPVGQNEDVVSALLGENEKRTAFLPKDTPFVVEGKLVDRWGTPYWFHPVSGREMEIRSAGPDRELFTGDDVTLP